MFDKLNAETKLMISAATLAGAWIIAFAAGTIAGNAIEEIYTKED